MKLVNPVDAMPITVSIVEDDPKTRQSLLRLLSRAPHVRCVGNYGTGEEALRGIPVEKPNVALVDINLPRMSGIECVAKLKLKLPDLRVLILTTYEDSERIFDSLRAGASGYLLKKAGYAGLVQAIDEVHAGGAPMSAQVARQVVEHFHRIEKPVSDMEKLTAREQEILTLLVKGYLYKEISDRLNISMSTVSMHLQHIYEKLHVQSRAEATAKFFGQI
ncbi:MAG TPA: response regulator transcription factor [Verrucomicrobiae bacterium]|nr:response regulator transcription factor [Verrucomicrobiae bacterium]HEV2453796.1 response regulator transcription factor [Verrucomicrobiae bacterium]